MPYALDGNPSQSEISDAVNYLLSNFNTGVTSDPNTGEIKGPTGEVLGYLYKYMAIKYADSFDGSVNFSNSPTNRQYFGIRNNDDPAESSNYTDYIWNKVTGGFGVTKVIWYISTGGRKIQFAASVGAPDTSWLVDPGSSIDLNIVTSGNIPVIAETFVPYFTPNTLQVPRTGGITPVFTNIIPVMYATDKGAVVPFTDAQTDTSVNFVNGSWRIGNSAITGNADISYTNITIGSPTDAGDYAQWPIPTAMPSSPAYITVPVRYKNSLGIINQAGVATVQLVFVDPGVTGSAGPTIDISGYTGFVQNAGGAFTPATATLSAITTNVTAPTYSWVISGATPTTASTASVVVTPGSSSTEVNVTLTVNGSNLTAAITKTIILPVIYNGAPGQAGSNGLMSAFPTIYLWTGSSTPPARPTTTSTYTWSGGTYTAPSGWSTTAPSNTVAGNYLWSITIPLNTSATTTTSTLDWTNTANPIRAIAFNGFNGTDGTNGTNGTRTAILEVYQWSATAPTTFPAGASTYTWATGQFTAPASLNGWSLTPPATVINQTLWIARTVYADNFTTATTNITWAASQSYPTGAAGANGTRTAFLEVYKWAATAPVTFPSGSSTYTWADGSFTAPTTANGWSLTPGSSTVGYTLYACSVRYADTNTSATSSVNWTTSTAYIVGAAGTNGTNGTNGSNGAATYVITRVANDSSSPTNAEVSTLLGRNPVDGDICTVSYNNFSNAVVYRYVVGWVLFQTYITGSLIVQNTITGDKISANTITGDRIAANTITASNITSNTITATQIAAATISATNMAANSITAANAAIADATITTAKIGDLQVTTAKIGDLQVETLKIAGNAVTVPTGAYTTGSANLPLTGGSTTLQSISYTSSGASVYIAFTAVISYSIQLRSPGSGGTYYPFRQSWQILLYRNGSLILTNFAFALYTDDLTAYVKGSNGLAISFSDTPSSGSVTYDVVIQETSGSSQVGYNGAGLNYYYVYNRNLFTLETKK